MDSERTEIFTSWIWQSRSHEKELSRQAEATRAYLVQPDLTAGEVWCSKTLRERFSTCCLRIRKAVRVLLAHRYWDLFLPSSRLRPNPNFLKSFAKPSASETLINISRLDYSVEELHIYCSTDNEQSSIIEKSHFKIKPKNVLFFPLHTYGVAAHGDGDDVPVTVEGLLPLLQL